MSKSEITKGSPMAKFIFYAVVTLVAIGFCIAFPPTLIGVVGVVVLALTSRGKSEGGTKIEPKGPGF